MKKFVFPMASGLLCCVLAAVPAHADVTGSLTSKMTFTTPINPDAVGLLATGTYKVSSTEFQPSNIHLYSELYVTWHGYNYYVRHPSDTFAAPVASKVGETSVEEGDFTVKSDAPTSDTYHWDTFLDWIKADGTVKPLDTSPVSLPQQ